MIENNISIELKLLICNEFFGALIDSKILRINEKSLLLNYIKLKQKIIVIGN